MRLWFVALTAVACGYGNPTPAQEVVVGEYAAARGACVALARQLQIAHDASADAAWSEYYEPCAHSVDVRWGRDGGRP